jgi:hypothetical protein
MQKVDPFAVFRTSLLVGLLAYHVVTMASSLARAAAALRGTDPHKRLLRAYIHYYLVSIRLRPLAGELLELAVWGAILLFIWWLYTLI